jgi:hypothetical protein
MAGYNIGLGVRGQCWSAEGGRRIGMVDVVDGGWPPLDGVLGAEGDR